MEMKVKPPVVLNLAGELAPELVAYFTRKNVKVINPMEEEFSFDTNFILTRNLQDFTIIDDTYKTLDNNIKVISLSHINDLQNFIFHNGKLILSEEWLTGSFGEFILDKFFLSSGGITIGENYPIFKEEGSFKIINPFNTGEYLDRLIHKSFEAGMSALSIKTYFDHLLMYLSGLKTKGKAGFPIEVSYGSFKETYGVQFHFFGQNLTLDDVTSSVSGSYTKKAEEYLLNVAVQSSDFFDLSYIHDVNKVVITGLWTRDERITYENRGLMFTNLTSVNAVDNFSGPQAASALISEEALPDMSSKIVLSSERAEEEFSQIIKDSGSVEEKYSQVIKGSDAEDSYSQKVLGSDSEEDFSQTVKGQKEVKENFKTILPPTEVVEELVTIVSGSIKEEMEVFKVTGGKKDVDKLVVKLSSAIEKSNAGDMRVKSLGQALPQTIKTGLYDFAKGMGKEVETLSQVDLGHFEKKELPEIVRRTIASTPVTVPQKEKKSPPPLFALPPSEKERILETKLSTSEKENEILRSSLKTLAHEMKVLRETRSKMSEMKLKSSAASVGNLTPATDEIMKSNPQQKTTEREMKLAEECKQAELLVKKLQIEADQKETFFAKELERVQRASGSKDLVLAKAKESFQKMLERKDEEVQAMRSRMDHVTKHLAGQSSSTQNNAIKDLEKQNQNLSKMNDVYKEKVSGLLASIESNRSVDGNSKDDLRRSQMVLAQNKNIIDTMKKDLAKLQERASNDSSTIMGLKQEKIRLEQLLKKLTLASQIKDVEPTNAAEDLELKRAKSHVLMLENQLRESSSKLKDLENKLQESSKARTSASPEDNSSKVKISHLETSLKKLTQDLVESRNSVNDMKKETNKLRQEKTALQNQVEKIKKDAEKAKAATPKKPSGGKAA